MPNPQIDQFAQSLFWKLVPWLILGGAIATFGGLAVKRLERRAIRFGRDWRSRRAASEEGRRSQIDSCSPSLSLSAAGPCRSDPAGSIAATESETPHCPICNALMVKRTARRGARAGSWFWGCPNFPDCHGTREL